MPTEFVPPDDPHGTVSTILEPSDPSILQAVETGICRHCLGASGDPTICPGCGRCSGAICGHSPYCGSRFLVEVEEPPPEA